MFEGLRKKKNKARMEVPPAKEACPNHVAFIMDGNGRWATARALPRTAGHKAGSQALHRIVEDCFNFGIQTVTVYAFSTENWKRPKDEIDGLMHLLLDYLDDCLVKDYVKEVCMRFLGDRSLFSAEILHKMEVLEYETKDHPYHLNICLNYGGRAEICRAFTLLAEKGITHPTEEDISSMLYTAPTGDPDLIIRTGGETRLSNFLLWQASYAELYFTDTLWPDFSRQELYDLLQRFAKTKRRYGGL